MAQTDVNVVDDAAEQKYIDELVEKVSIAQKKFGEYSQEQVDKIFKAAATAADKARIPLAKMAIEETRRSPRLTKKRDVDMTQGSVVGHLVRFAVPLIAGSLFQQLYNMVDTWVIGQTGVNAAYAAVGSIGPVTNILIGFYSGFATGAGVIISQYFGRKDNEGVQKAVHTTIFGMLILCAVCSLCFGVASAVFAGTED